jgi:hypothetical protein
MREERMQQAERSLANLRSNIRSAIQSLGDLNTNFDYAQLANDTQIGIAAIQALYVVSSLAVSLTQNAAQYAPETSPDCWRIITSKTILELNAGMQQNNALLIGANVAGEELALHGPQHLSWATERFFVPYRRLAEDITIDADRHSQATAGLIKEMQARYAKVLSEYQELRAGGH